MTARRPKGGESVSPETERVLSAKDQLKALITSAEIRDLSAKSENTKDKDVFEIKITDKERWQSEEEIKKLVGLFGALVVVGYGSREKPPVYDPDDPEMVEWALSDIAEGEISMADKIFVIAENDKIVSFSTVEQSQLSDGRSLGYASLSMTAPEYQNQGYGAETLNHAFADGNYDVVFGISHTPAWAKIAQTVGQKNGYDNFFCGFKEGVLNDRGTPAQQRDVEWIQDTIIEKWREDDFMIPESMPNGFVVVDQKIMPIPERKKKEVQFPKAHPLQQVFEKALIPTQKKYSAAGHVVFGISTHIKRKNTDSE